MNRTATLAALAALSIGLAACEAQPDTPQLSADMALSGKVKEALQEPARSHVEVAAADGVVTLYGMVEGHGEKERIALLAMSVDGVRSVINNLIVLRSS